MRTVHLKAFEAYIIAALALATWALANPAAEYCFAAAGASVALATVGVNEAIARRFWRPDPPRCNPPACYCGNCDECQRILRFEGVIARTERVDFDFKRP